MVVRYMKEGGGRWKVQDVRWEVGGKRKVYIYSSRYDWVMVLVGSTTRDCTGTHHVCT